MIGIISNQSNFYKEKAASINNAMEELVSIHYDETPYADYFKGSRGVTWALKRIYGRTLVSPRRIGFLQALMQPQEPKDYIEKGTEVKLKFIQRGSND